MNQYVASVLSEYCQNEEVYDIRIVLDNAVTSSFTITTKAASMSSPFATDDDMPLPLLIPITKRHITSRNRNCHTQDSSCHQKIPVTTASIQKVIFAVDQCMTVLSDNEIDCCSQKETRESKMKMQTNGRFMLFHHNKDYEMASSLKPTMDMISVRPHIRPSIPKHDPMMGTNHKEPPKMPRRISSSCLLLFHSSSPSPQCRLTTRSNHPLTKEHLTSVEMKNASWSV